jgi:hypothetical protein
MTKDGREISGPPGGARLYPKNVLQSGRTERFLVIATWWMIALLTILEVARTIVLHTWGDWL